MEEISFIMSSCYFIKIFDAFKPLTLKNIMPKQATEFPYGKQSVFGRNIPLKSNGGLNRVYLTITDFHFILLITIFFVSATVYAQDSKYMLKDFKFTELSEVDTRKDIMDKYVCAKQSYTAIALSTNLKDKVSQTVINSFNEWNSLVIIPKMDDRYIWINDQAIVAVDNIISNNQNEKIIKDESILEINKELINEMSLILNVKGDTLVLIPIKVELANRKTDKLESKTYLYYLNMKVINKINLEMDKINLIKKVVQLEEHASKLIKYGLELDQSNIDQFNTNIQNRVIDSINSALINMPKIYLVVANNIVSTAQFFQPKVSAYIVLETEKNNFISNEEKCNGFPKGLNAGLFNSTMTDSVELYFDKNELIKKIRTINYYEYFTKKYYDNRSYSWQTKKPVEWEEVHSMYTIGYPKMDSTSILHHAEETWWGVASEYKKSGYRPEKLEFNTFFQNHVTNDTLSRQRLIKIQNTFAQYPKLTWYSLVQQINFTENGLSVNVRFGDPSEERFKLHKDFQPDESDEFNRKSFEKEWFNSYCFQTPERQSGICAFDRDKLYQFYSAYMDIYSSECNKIESIQSNVVQNEEQNEEQQQQKLNEKYGKKYVDAMLKLTIIVGMHEDLVNQIVNKLYYVESNSSSANQKCYRLEPKYGTGWVSVCIANKKVSSVAYH